MRDLFAIAKFLSTLLPFLLTAVLLEALASRKGDSLRTYGMKVGIKKKLKSLRHPVVKTAW